MRYDFIREAMKGRCYKRENGKRIAMFFFFLLILFGIWGGKKKDKRRVIYIARIKSILMMFRSILMIFVNCQSLCNVVKILFDDRFLLKNHIFIINLDKNI